MPPVVTGDLPCRRCSYNLRSLATSSLCPECGSPVAHSMQGDRLRFSDPQWLNKLLIGAWCATAGLISSVMFGPIPQRAIGFPGPGLFIVESIGSFLGFLVFLSGAWLISTPDPSQPIDDPAARWPRFLRILIYIELARSLTFRVAFSLPIWANHTDLLHTIYVLADLLSAVVYFVLFRVLQFLALRIPDSAHARTANRLAYALALTIALITPFHLSMSYLYRYLFRHLAWTPLWYTLGDLIVLVTKILAISFLYRFAATLKNEFQDAQQTWSTAKPPSAIN